jgi:hypothetical protein
MLFLRIPFPWVYGLTHAYHAIHSPSMPPGTLPQARMRPRDLMRSRTPKRAGTMRRASGSHDEPARR